jgi:hypothetical protein
MSAVLPSEDLIKQGLADLDARNETVAGLLVCIGAPRLRRLGFELSTTLPKNPEEGLYDMLATVESMSFFSSKRIGSMKEVPRAQRAEVVLIHLD